MTDEALDVVASCILVDEITHPEHERPANLVGGAGLYAAIGVGLAGGRPALATGIGADYPALLGEWIKRNGVVTQGLRVAVDLTPRNRIVYGSDDSRTEEPLFGMAHFHACEPTPDDIAPLLPGARLAYVFNDSDPAFWHRLADARAAAGNGSTLLWEVSLDACTPDQVSQFHAAAELVDAVSLNMGEAMALTGQPNPEDAMRALGALTDRPIFLRAGSEGSFLIEGQTRTFVPTAQVAPFDVTGGGNAYSGAAAVALSRGNDLLDCARMGTAAALVTIARRGPFDFYPGSEARNEFATILEDLRSEQERCTQ